MSSCCVCGPQPVRVVRRGGVVRPYIAAHAQSRGFAAKYQHGHTSHRRQSLPDEVDVLVIGSGVGGLCAASLLASYGMEVGVVEAHSAPGGAAHHWSRGPFSFDSGAALFSGINPLQPSPQGKSNVTTDNPLSSVLAAVGERVPGVVNLPDSATCLVYPDGKQYRTQLGSTKFVDVVEERHGAEAARQWREFQAEVDRLCESAGAVAPAAVRLDSGVGLTVVFRRPLQFLKYLLGGSGTSGKTFGDVVDSRVQHPAVLRLISMVTEGTTSAAPAEIDASYMLRAFHEMWGPRTVLQYPKEGSQGIVDTLIRGLERHGGSLHLRTRATKIFREDPVDSSLNVIGSDWEAARAAEEETPRKAVAVEITGPKGETQVVRVRHSIVSNASVWDSARIFAANDASDRTAAVDAPVAVRQRVLVGAGGMEEVEEDAGAGVPYMRASSAAIGPTGEPQFDMRKLGSVPGLNAEPGRASWSQQAQHAQQGLREDFEEYVQSLEMNASMLHLHIGFEAREGEDLPVHTYFLESEHSGSNGWPTIVIPSAAVSGLAPPGHHVLHATITEPFEPWQGIERGSPEYNARKEQRGEILWDMVRQIIPDIDSRVKVSCLGTPQSQERFLRRKCGTYGPANLLTLTGALPKAVRPLDNVWCCGDSVFPGVGTPAVAANGMWVANSLVSVPKHMQMLDSIGV